jgi:chorismate dehydratase
VQQQLLLKIGRISFIHNDPAFYYLEHKPPNDVQLTSATPRELLTSLLREELDFAPISSIAIQQHQDKLTPVPALSVHSEGPALSAIVIARKDHEIRDGSQIAITNYTETSAQMLDAILRKKKIKTEFIQSNFTSADELLQEAPYALVIGNEALAAYAANDRRKMFDLGEEWWSTTRQPAVFAVSAVRTSLLMSGRADVERILSLIRESLEYGYANLGRVIDQTAKHSGFQPSLLAEYFEHLRLDYTKRVEQGYEYLANTLGSNSHDL